MKKFPIIEAKIEKDGVYVELPEEEPELPKIKTKPEDIFVKKAEKPSAKASKASEKQLAHLETIRAKALLARQNKKKEGRPLEPPQPQVEVEPIEPPPPLPVKVEDTPKPPPIVGDTPIPPPIERSREVGRSPPLYTKSQMDDYAKEALVNYHTQERDRRIAEVRKKQVELDEQRKKYDVSLLLKKGGRNRMW
jgi:hypothetical protein